MPLQLHSSAFTHQGEVPLRYTCDGDDVSPPLSWEGVPPQARSLVLIIDDPDAPDPRAPRTVWAHWLLYNLPPQTTGLGEGIPTAALPAGTLQGLNDWRAPGYRGPCPPSGRHRYFHKLYALDTRLPDLRSPNKAQLEWAMQGHILAEAQLIGLYQRH